MTILDVDDSIQMLDISKRNLNVNFILGNTGHSWRGLIVRVLDMPVM